MLDKPAKTVKRARRLRRDLSLPEVLLWRLLRGRLHGLKFRRQHPAGSLVLDFYCAEAKLCVEIDGETHCRGDQSQFDETRDKLLESHGINTLRIAAKDVLGDIEAVMRMVMTQARAGLPLHHPSGGPPPHARHGED